MATSPDDRRPGLRPPQFGMATMMITMAVLGAGFAMITYFGAYVASVIALFALMVLVHIAGNALGTKLRQNGDTPIDEDGQLAASATRDRQPAAVEFAPTTRLRDRGSLGLPVAVATVAGFIVTSGVGAVLLPLALSRAPTVVAWIAGSIACGVLGAIATFITFSFIQVASDAVWQATREPTLKNPKTNGHP